MKKLLLALAIATLTLTISCKKDDTAECIKVANEFYNAKVYFDQQLQDESITGAEYQADILNQQLIANKKLEQLYCH